MLALQGQRLGFQVHLVLDVLQALQRQVQKVAAAASRVSSTRKFFSRARNPTNSACAWLDSLLGWRLAPSPQPSPPGTVARAPVRSCAGVASRRVETRRDETMRCDARRGQYCPLARSRERVGERVETPHRAVAQDNRLGRAATRSQLGGDRRRMSEPAQAGESIASCPKQSRANPLKLFCRPFSLLTFFSARKESQSPAGANTRRRAASEYKNQPGWRVAPQVN